MNNKLFRQLKRYLRMFLFLFFIFVLQHLFLLIIGIFPKLFSYIFLIYPGSEREIKVFAPKWIYQKPHYRTRITLGGILTKPKTGIVGRGLLLVVPSTVRNMLASPDNCKVLKENLQKFAERHSIEAISIAGRGPSIFLHHGIKLDGIFVQGGKGMVFSTIKTLEDVIKKHSLSILDTKICIFGAGRVGTIISDYLKSQSHKVSIVKANSIFDKNSTDVKVDEVSLYNADIIIVISAKGSDIYPYLKHLKDGAIIIDDTHPRIAKSFKEGIVYRANLGLEGIKFVPSLPGYSPYSIPGCVVESIVRSSLGEYKTQQEFNKMADTLGFYSRNVFPRTEV